jgi:hypothetical protein
LDANKPVAKAVKQLQACVKDLSMFKAEKLQKNLKSNKSEFLRLLAVYPNVIFFSF